MAGGSFVNQVTPGRFSLRQVRPERWGGFPVNKQKSRANPARLRTGDGSAIPGMAFGKTLAVRSWRKALAVDAGRGHGRVFQARDPQLALPSLAFGRGTRPAGASSVTCRAWRVPLQPAKLNSLDQMPYLRPGKSHRAGIIHRRSAAAAACRARCRGAWLPRAGCSRGSSAQCPGAW